MDQALALNVRALVKIQAWKMAYHVGAFVVVGEVNGDVGARVNEKEAAAVVYSKVA